MATNLVTERVADLLLGSISQDLRTPLTTIRGALSDLQQDEASRGRAAHSDRGTHRNAVAPSSSSAELDDETRRNLIENAAQEADRLNHVIGNLLDMARVETGALGVVLVPCDVEDAIGSALEQVQSSRQGRRVTANVPPGLPLVPMDFAWIVKVLGHLIDNAVRYSPPVAPIAIHVRQRGDQIVVTVADRGIGIPADHLTHVFDKFYRVPSTEGALGTGLGLAICQGVVAAHRGEIRAANRTGGGTIVTVTLPVV